MKEITSRAARTIDGFRKQISKLTSGSLNSAPRRVYGAAWASGALSNAVLYLFAISALSEETRGLLTVILSTAYLVLVGIVTGRDRAGLLKLSSSGFISTGVGALFMRKTFWAVLATSVIIIFVFLIFPGPRILMVALMAGVVLALTAQEYLLFQESISARAKFSRHVLLFHFLVILGSLGLFVTGAVRLEMWLSIYPLAGIPMVISATRTLLRTSPGSLPSAAKANYRKLATLGIKLFPGELVQFLGNRADRFLVAMTLGAGAVGKLIVFLVFFELMSYPLRILVTTSAPRASNSRTAERRSYGRPKGNVPLRASWVFGFLTLSIAATAILLQLAGYSLSDPYNLLLLGAVSGAFLAKIWLFSVGTALIRAGKANLQFVSLLIASGLMVGLILAMAPITGLVGAPLAILTSATFATWWARTKLTRVLGEKNHGRPEDPGELVVRPEISVMRNKLGHLLQQFEQGYNLLISLKRKDSFREMPPSGILFLSEDSLYSEATAEGKKFNRIIDTLAIRLSRDGESSAHLGRPPSNLPRAGTHHTIYSANRGFAKAFARDILTSRPTQVQLKHRVSFFKEILRQVQPKVVFTTESRGYMWIAARELNIPLIEILHGIGYEDLTRTPTFSRISSEGLPDYLISFDKNSSRSWVELSNNPSGLLDCQNFWLENFLSKDGPPLGLPNFIAPQFPTHGYAKRVLVSLTWSQPFDHASRNPEEIRLGLLEGLLSAIEASEAEIFWMLRMHPVQFSSKSFRHRYKTKRLVKWSERHPNVEVRTTSSAPLPLVLPHATHHVTWDSMASYEAADFGVKTFALRPHSSKGAAGHLHPLENEGYVVFGNGSDVLQWVASTEPTAPRMGWTWGLPVEDELTRLWSS